MGIGCNDDDDDDNVSRAMGNDMKLSRRCVSMLGYYFVVHILSRSLLMVGYVYSSQVEVKKYLLKLVRTKAKLLRYSTDGSSHHDMNTCYKIRSMLIHMYMCKCMNACM